MRPRRRTTAATKNSSPRRIVERSEKNLPIDDPRRWLQLHAAALIGRLQQWATELERRETELAHRIARQSQRERELRLQHQDLERQRAEVGWADLRRAMRRNQTALNRQTLRLKPTPDLSHAQNPSIGPGG